MKDEQLISRLHDKLRERTGVDLRLDLWNGVSLGPAQASYALSLAHPWSASTVLRRHIGLAAGEAYVEGAIDFQGDLIALMHQFSAIASARFTWRDWLVFLALRQRLAREPRNSHPRRAQLSGKMHSKDRDRAAIKFHYDLPQGFYEQFLDANLVYSCAYFSDVNEDLRSAQIRKLDLICRKLQLRPGVRFLDIGCGWASLLIRCGAALRRAGRRGHALRDSGLRAGRDRIERSGLAERIEIRLQDYRDVQEHDAISSIGMLEHVGRPSSRPMSGSCAGSSRRAA